MKGKKGMSTVMVVVLLVLGVGALWMFGVFEGLGDQLAAAPEDTAEARAEERLECPIEDVSLKYSDFDSHKRGTDPGAQLYIIDGDVSPQSLNDDGSLTVPVNAEITALLGENSSTYFTQELSFNVDCMDPFYLSSELDKVSDGHSLTIINDDGVTKNSDSNHESMGASTEYTAEVTVRSDADECICGDLGCVVAVEYDATYFQEITSDLDAVAEAIYITHNSSGTTANAGTHDQWKTFDYPGRVCDSEKMEFILTVETTSTEPTEDVNPEIWILPRDRDKNEDTLEVIEGLYDEDNNLLSPQAVNGTYYCA